MTDRAEGRGFKRRPFLEMVYEDNCMGYEKNDYVLETRKICKNFGALKANDNINLKVKRQTIHAILGENGAGKSTLMNILTNIYKADSGDILINGKIMRFKNPRDAARAGIGMVYQEFMLARELTVLENIIIGYEEGKGPFIDKKENRRKCVELCKKYHLDLPLDEKLTELPVAVLQQIEIAKVLFRGADIIIMDEPTSALTPQGIEGLFLALKELKNQGKTIILITHKLDEIFAVSDVLTIMRDGKLIGTFEPFEINQQQAANLMVGREVVLEAQKVPCHPGKTILNIEKLHVRDSEGIERVKGVDLQVHAGEIVGIAGVAGAGQQFLVEALFGLRNPEKNSRIEFKGENIVGKSPGELRKSGIGYVPQDRISTGCNTKGNLWENAIMGYHRAHGFTPKWRLDRKQANAFTMQVLKTFDVKYQSVEEPIGSLSGGNIQKLIVGREFLQNCDLLIIEDPTRGIDVGAIEYIWAKIIEFAAGGTAILLVSHELNEIMQLSDHIYVMYNGYLRDGGGHGELNENEIGLIMTGGKHDE